MVTMEKPPRDALSGDTIPRENGEDEQFRVLVDSIVAQMNKRETYRQLTEPERREKAQEIAKRRFNR